jgi:hypothetical protein
MNTLHFHQEIVRMHSQGEVWSTVETHGQGLDLAVINVQTNVEITD